MSRQRSAFSFQFSILCALCASVVSIPAVAQPYAPYAQVTGPLQWTGALCDPLPGDVDLDGDVDAIDADWFAWFATGPCIPWGCDPRWCVGRVPLWVLDFDRDGDIDADDFGELQRHCGEVRF